MFLFLNEHYKIDDKKKAFISLACQHLLDRLIKGKVRIEFRWVHLENENHAYVTRPDQKKQHYIIFLGDHLAHDFNLLLRSLSHEVVHIKQMATGQLTLSFQNMPSIICWKKTKTSKPVFINEIRQDQFLNHADYYNAYTNLPWEKEAFERMNILYLDVYSHLLKKRNSNVFVHLYNFLLSKNEFFNKKSLKNMFGISLWNISSVYKIVEEI